MTSRRTFLVTFAGGILVAPLAAGAQQPGKVYRIGLLWPTPVRGPGLDAFVRGLRERGYVEGRNLVIDFRPLEGMGERLPGIAAELVRLRPDVIFAPGPEAVLRAASQATTTIPIVVLAVDFDPIARGYVASLARPGGNITGVFVRQPELAAKRVELLKEALPRARRVAVFWDTFSADHLNETENAGRVLGLQLQLVELRNPPYDLAGAFRSAEQGRADAVLSSSSPVLWVERARFAELAAKSRLPVIVPYREMVAGALLAYGVNLLEMYRYAATHVDKILKGAKPADLPVEQPTKYELLINLKTAKALGLTIPQALLVRADELIE